MDENYFFGFCCSSILIRQLLLKNAGRRNVLVLDLSFSMPLLLKKHKDYRLDRNEIEFTIRAPYRLMGTSPQDSTSSRLNTDAQTIE
jgi:hypothetical protein